MRIKRHNLGSLAATMNGSGIQAMEREAMVKCSSPCSTAKGAPSGTSPGEN